MTNTRRMLIIANAVTKKNRDDSLRTNWKWFGSVKTKRRKFHLYVPASSFRTQPVHVSRCCNYAYEHSKKLQCQGQAAEQPARPDLNKLFQSSIRDTELSHILHLFLLSTCRMWPCSPIMNWGWTYRCVSERENNGRRSVQRDQEAGHALWRARAPRGEEE